METFLERYPLVLDCPTQYLGRTNSKNLTAYLKSKLSILRFYLLNLATRWHLTWSLRHMPPPGGLFLWKEVNLNNPPLELKSRLQRIQRKGGHVKGTHREETKKSKPWALLRHGPESEGALTGRGQTSTASTQHVWALLSLTPKHRVKKDIFETIG